VCLVWHWWCPHGEEGAAHPAAAGAGESRTASFGSRVPSVCNAAALALPLGAGLTAGGTVTAVT